MIPHAPQREPLYDIVPETDVSIEVFYSDRTLETFGRSGAGWFWWPRRRGFSPNGLATGPFATSYAAYRHAVTTPAPIILACPKAGHRLDTECQSNCINH
jgi:hypothetical protein